MRRPLGGCGRGIEASEWHKLSVRGWGMAICGRCGLFTDEIDDDAGGGRCAWLNLRRYPEEKWETWDCPDYLARIEGLSLVEHLEWQRARAEMTYAAEELIRSTLDRRFSRIIELIGVMLTIFSLFGGLIAWLMSTI